MDVMYSSGIGNPGAVKAVNPVPRPNPIIIAVGKNRTPKTAAPRKENRLIGPEKRPCLACRSSWGAGLEMSQSLKREFEVGWELTLVNVGQHTALGNGDVSKELVQLLVVPDGELEMAGNDTRLLVVTGSISGQLEDFSSQVFKDSGEVDGSTGTNTLSVVALPQQTVDTTDGKSETGLGRTTNGNGLVNGYKKWHEIQVV